MSVAAGKLVTQANACIALGTQGPLAVAQLAGIQEVLSTVYSVANTAALPTACDNTGRVIFVCDIGVYRYSDGTQWTGDFTSTWTGACAFLWGSNTSGRLGNNSTTSTSSPVRESGSGTCWVQIVTDVSTAAIRGDGTLWSWGNNLCGALGDGTTTDRSSPVREISSSSTWCQVTTRGCTGNGIKTNGTLWGWGANSCGQLGTNTISDSVSPVREISLSTTWCQVATGTLHTAAIKTDGTLWSWGANNWGQLGTNTTVDTSSPVREISSSSTWISVSASNHTVALKRDDSVWAWGLNSCGQLGDNSAVDRSSPVQEVTKGCAWASSTAGRYHTMAVKNDGTLWSWGRNQCGQLGNNATTPSSSPVQEFSSSTSWCQISAGQCHSGATKTDGTLWTWGANTSGQLGDNTTVTKTTPVREITSSSSWSEVSAGVGQTSAVLGRVKGFLGI
jgi:alpha-tubulin suppressor-like RCC1 family protein